MKKNHTKVYGSIGNDVEHADEDDLALVDDKESNSSAQRSWRNLFIIAVLSILISTTYVLQTEHLPSKPIVASIRRPSNVNEGHSFLEVASNNDTILTTEDPDVSRKSDNHPYDTNSKLDVRVQGVEGKVGLTEIDSYVNRCPKNRQVITSFGYMGSGTYAVCTDCSVPIFIKKESSNSYARWFYRCNDKRGSYECLERVGGNNEDPGGGADYNARCLFGSSFGGGKPRYFIYRYKKCLPGWNRVIDKCKDGLDSYLKPTCMCEALSPVRPPVPPPPAPFDDSPGCPPGYACEGNNDF